MKSKFPEVQGGGSLILAWQIRNKNVLVIGGGEVGSVPEVIIDICMLTL
jgi:precorrin-2 dehydrogenase/sirohydrochlorin ferrochelatase